MPLSIRLIPSAAALFLCVLGGLSCKESPTQPQRDALAVLETTSTEVTLRINGSAPDKAGTAALRRDKEVIASFVLSERDTVITDSGLQPSRTYSYTLEEEHYRTTVQASTMDTTSHDIQWQSYDTLGAYGSVEAIWVLHRNDVIAAGVFRLSDGKGGYDLSTHYNVARWDGTSWKLKKVSFELYNIIWTPNINSLFVYNVNDIWYGGGSLIHWDGSTNTRVSHVEALGNFEIKSVWGSPTHDIFIVGDSGSIARYSNGTWIKMNSKTKVDLADIWGTSSDDVWATGTNIRDGKSVLLWYNGSEWTIMYDNQTAGIDMHYIRSVWTDSKRYVYLYSQGFYKMLKSDRSFIPIQKNGINRPAFLLRASAPNDMFVVGQVVEVGHWNGISWRTYPELLSVGDADLKSVHVGDNMVVAGGFIFNGLYGGPFVIRGYR